SSLPMKLRLRPTRFRAGSPRSSWASVASSTTTMSDIWYERIGPGERLTQGDIVFDCPLVSWSAAPIQLPGLGSAVEALKQGGGAAAGGSGAGRGAEGGAAVLAVRLRGAGRRAFRPPRTPRPGLAPPRPSQRRGAGGELQPDHPRGLARTAPRAEAEGRDERC